MRRIDTDSKDPYLARFQDRCLAYAAALVQYSEDEVIWDAGMTFLDLGEFAEGVVKYLDGINLVLKTKYPDAERPETATADYLIGAKDALEQVLRNLILKPEED